jgi:2-polyprenyl-3-methyl-5-hydroxy-6-metoxy-1,4-benzoquinol methylase
LGNPPWLIDNYSVRERRLTISGWALPPDGYQENWTFLLNGRSADKTRYPISTPSLEKVFSFCAGSGNAGFVLDLELSTGDELVGHVKVEFVNKFSGLPMCDYHNQYIDLRPQLEVPDDDQLFRTQGNRSIERYKLHGYTTYKKIETLLYRYSERKLANFRSVLDWGCGCGRLTQQFAQRASAGTVIHGIDIDKLNIDWCHEHIKGARFDTVPLRPPTSLPSEFYSLIVGVSVMTHLALETQKAWLDELRRVAAPQAYIILTTHGETALSRVKDITVIQNTLSFGSDERTMDRSLENAIESTDYYRSSYHMGRFARKLFGQYFDVVDIIPGGNASIQDFVIMRKIPPE